MARRRIVRDDEPQSPDVNLSAMARLLGRAGGQSKSRAKVAAARENGKRGGRPKLKR